MLQISMPNSKSVPLSNFFDSLLTLKMDPCRISALTPAETLQTRETSHMHRLMRFKETVTQTMEVNSVLQWNYGLLNHCYGRQEYYCCNNETVPIVPGRI